MTYREILSRVDHTLLKQGATWEQIEAVCDDGLRFGTASVCIPPSFVKQAAEYLKGRLPVCTVIGFPNGYNTTAVKVYETAEAVGNGADEIDMVVNLGWVKEGRYDRVLEEINAVKKACAGRLLKVIIETCLLTEEEKTELCRTVTRSDAEFIKTSTGFSTGGATEEDVKLLKRTIKGGMGIKASGGISSIEDGVKLVSAGAGRLGTSRIVKLVKEAER